MEIARLILEFLKVVIWPITTAGLIFLFRKELAPVFGEFLEFLKRAKKIGLPGGVSLEAFEEKIIEARTVAEEREAEKETKLLNQPAGSVRLEPPKFTESDANKRMIELGLRPSPSGLNLDYYRGIAERDPTLALAGLRIDLELMLRNLIKGFDIETSGRESISSLLNKAFDRGGLTSRQYTLSKRVFELANSAIHGTRISKAQANEVLDVAQVLIDDYISWLYWNFSGSKNP